VSEVSVPGRRDSSVEAQSRAQGLNIGWTVFSYLLSGMAAYGLIGWLIGRAVGVSMLFPIGMLVGLAISLGFVIWRYGRPAGLGQQESPAGLGQQESNASAGEDNDTKTGMSAAASRRASHRRGIPREEKSR
jgi:F0F1-type ATP synthase assembly protein I